MTFTVRPRSWSMRIVVRLARRSAASSAVSSFMSLPTIAWSKSAAASMEATRASKPSTGSMHAT